MPISDQAPCPAPAETQPLYESLVPAGFPSPADDHLEGDLDVRQLLIRRPAATFFCRASGESMTAASSSRLAGTPDWRLTGISIHDGDMLVVDRSIDPVAGDVVVATVGDGMTCKRLAKGEDGAWLLVPANPDFPVIPIDPVEGVKIWGVVTWALTQLCKR